jgi:hypothetical protein
MFTLSNVPCWYLTAAILVSSYQAYRGFMFQWILGTKAIAATAHRVILLCVADMITYLVSAFSGFISLFVLYRLASHELDSANAQSDHALMIFLVLYGILGVTGKLPDLLQNIKLPGTAGKP